MKDFPDPVNGEPLVDTYQIPSSNRPGGMTILNAAMQKCGNVLRRGGGGPRVRRKTWALAAAAVLVAATATGGVVVMSGAEHPTAAAQAPPANTAKVEQGKLSADGLPGRDPDLPGATGRLAVLRDQPGPRVYTELPESGDKVGCGGVLYRVDDKPVLLLCGTVPAYRALHVGDAGRDVRQLNRNLHVRGADATSVHHATRHARRAGAQGAPAPQGRSRDRRARPRRRGLPARGGADRQGHRPARRIRPAGCAGR